MHVLRFTYLYDDSCILCKNMQDLIKGLKTESIFRPEPARLVM